MKIADWNIEWMNDWFTPISAGPSAWQKENEASGITDVAALAGRVAQVIRALAPDAITIQEGPSRESAMQLFVYDFLDSGFEVFSVLPAALPHGLLWSRRVSLRLIWPL